MAEIVPTILAANPHEYATCIERVRPFARRLHIDISDGNFTPAQTIGLAQAYGIDGVALDLHLMLQEPVSEYENSLSLEPNLVILHFESAGDIASLLKQYKQVGVRTGLAILPQTAIDQIKNLLPHVDHLLIFTGKLGYYGGELDVSQLGKVAAAKAINPQLEVAIDGGVNLQTCQLALNAGADVLDVGSAIQMAADPAASYESLNAIAAGAAV